jgi:hypothetical protein
MAPRTGAAIASLLAIAGVVSCSGRTAAPIDDVSRVQSALLTTVVVTVEDTNGTAQVGATVYSETNGAFLSTATTDAQGKATFSLADGAYRFATPGLENCCARQLMSA